MESNYVAFSFSLIEKDLATCRYSDEFCFSSCKSNQSEFNWLGFKGVSFSKIHGKLSHLLRAKHRVIHVDTHCAARNVDEPTYVKENLGQTGVAVARARAFFVLQDHYFLLGDYAVYTKVGAIVGHDVNVTNRLLDRSSANSYYIVVQQRPKMQAQWWMLKITWSFKRQDPLKSSLNSFNCL
ncbi:hypothetical protein K0M31_012874 [Melipona bicolor]|uniref:Uncharacterized protein n=1 Tax=Melipona bicolor TaxID=60889 RepID=A0AA40FIV3_9HYME|nr:hypothetical protein K0M31_012874 [Melipona bicolor]